METKKTVWILIIGVLIVIAYLVGQGSDHPATTSQPQQQPSTQNAGNVNLVALKSKCSTDGKNFVQNYEQQNGSPKAVWYTPEFHYDTKLNTCLVYIGYAYQIYESPIDINNSNYSAELTIYNFVFDVYSNNILLQNVNDRKNINGKNTDTLSSYPIYSNVPNLTNSAFTQQMEVLMGE